MSHYFIADPSLPDDERILHHRLFDRVFTFKTNSGLFSYTEIDYASELLLKNIPTLEGRLLDLGCGYGFIGIVLATATGLSVTMSDVNPSALHYARINAALNKVQAIIINSDCFGNIDSLFNYIITNPPVHAGKEVVFRMYEEGHGHLHDNGAFFTIIQKKHGAESHIKKIKEIYKECLILYKRKGYYILQGKK